MKKFNLKNVDLFFINENEFHNKNDLLYFKKNLDKKSIIIYHSELTNKKEIIRNIIKYNNNDNEIIIHTRKCNIKKIINYNEKNKFLNNNHIQGTDKSSIIYGTYFNNDLVAIMTFDNKRQMNGGEKENEYELTRFAVKKNHIITGIFNKLLKSFVNEYKPKKIFSFADRRFSDSKNNIYVKNGFKLIKTLPPDYHYYNREYSKKLLHKFGFGKSSIKTKFSQIYDPNKTEWEMMDSLNFNRIWDCGKFRYELYFNENQEKIFGFIYMIKNKSNNKIYIGQTTRNLIKRMYEYKSAFNRNLSNNKYLLNSFNKYGFDNFEFSVIDTAINIDELNEKEIFYIKKYNSIDKKIGYNIELGGRNAIPGIETLEKMSRSHKGIKQNENWIQSRIAKADSEDAKKYGKMKTEEEKRIISENSPKYWQGKQRDEETRLKISRTKKKNGLSDKQKEVICKKVVAYNPITNKVIDTFDSTALAAIPYGVSQSTISRRCSGKTKNKGDVYFKFE